MEGESWRRTKRVLGRDKGGGSYRKRMGRKGRVREHKRGAEEEAGR